MPFEEKLQNIQRIVLEVFVADIIECVQHKHRRKICHLNYKYAIRIKDSGDITDKRIRVLEIIEHGDSGNDLCFCILVFLLIWAFGEKIIKHMVTSLLCSLHKILRRFKADANNPGMFVRPQKRTVIASYIKDNISRLKISFFFKVVSTIVLLPPDMYQ